MKRLAILGFLFAATPVQADTTVTLDISFAENVLADVCSGNQIDETAIRRSSTVANMLAHFGQFRDYFTMDAYLASRQQAAHCQKADRDIFRFNDVIDKKQALLAELATMKNTQQDYSHDLASMLTPFVPANIPYSGRATIAIGTPSCGGWSAGPDFYVDLPCIMGDAPGLLYLIAHESYHGIQDKFMPRPVKTNHVARLFSAVMREGSATAIADFSKITGGGSYTASSKQSIKRNAARSQQNFGLLDMAVAYIRYTSGAEAYDVANNIGLSGSFDAPYYAVGATIFNAVDEADGREVLLCLMQKPPKLIFKRYLMLAEHDKRLHQFGASTIGELRSVEKGALDICIRK